MKIKKIIPMGMLLTMPLMPKAQILKFVPEAGLCGTAKTAPMLIGGLNTTYAKNNFADVFVGGTLNKDVTPGFLGIAYDNYSWNKNISSWARDLFMASKNGITSTLDVAPIKVNIPVNKFIFSIMPAYCRNDDFVNHIATHSIKGIFQSLFSITSDKRIALEMQYGTNPAQNIKDSYSVPFKDGFNFTVTYSQVL